MMAKEYKRQHGLTIEQQNAIDLLVMGKTDKEVAEIVGVNRVTVTQWRLYDPYFQAELNKRRQEIWSTAIEKIRCMVLKALDVVDKALDKGSVKTALEVLKIAGLDKANLGEIGEIDPERILEKLALESRKQMVVSEFEKMLVKESLEKKIKDFTG